MWEQYLVMNDQDKRSAQIYNEDKCKYVLESISGATLKFCLIPATNSKRSNRPAFCPHARRADLVRKQTLVPQKFFQRHQHWPVLSGRWPCRWFRYSTMVTETILSPRLIALTTSMSEVRPKTVCTPSSQGVATWVMKNWLPPVSLPAWAIESVPGVCFC